MKLSNSRLFVCMIAITGLLLFSGSSFGSPVHAGLTEFNMAGSFTSTEGATSYMLGVAYGKFVTDQIEVGGNLTIQGQSYDGDSATMFTPSVFAAFFFPIESDKIAPYVGAQVGLMTGSGMDSITQFGAVAGIKYFISEGGAITVQPQLLMMSGGGGSATSFGISTGISLFF